MAVWDVIPAVVVSSDDDSPQDGPAGSGPQGPRAASSGGRNGFVRSHEPVFFDQNLNQLFWERNANTNAREEIVTSESGSLLQQLGITDPLKPGETLLDLIINGIKDQLDFSDFYDRTEIDAIIAAVPIFTAADYYDKTAIDGLLQDQYDDLVRAINAALASVSVDLSNYYNRPEIDALLAALPTVGGNVDLSNYYTKGDCDSKFLGISTFQSFQAVWLTSVSDMTVQIEGTAANLNANYYNKTTTDALLSGLKTELVDGVNVAIQDVTQTLDGLNQIVDSVHSALITDYYKKPEVDALLPDLAPYAKSISYENFFARGITGNEFFVYMAPAAGRPGAEGVGWQIGIDAQPGPTKDRLGIVKVKFDNTSPTHYPDLWPGVPNKYEIIALLSDLKSYATTDELDTVRAEFDAFFQVLVNQLDDKLKLFTRLISKETLVKLTTIQQTVVVVDSYDLAATAGQTGRGWTLEVIPSGQPYAGRLGYRRAFVPAFDQPITTNGSHIAFLGDGDIATTQEVTEGTAGRLIDGAGLKTAIMQLGQYVEEKFTTVDQGAGLAQPGWVFTLVKVNGLNGASETTYGWRPLPPGGGAVDLSAYAKLVDRGQRVEADALSGENVVLRPRGAVDATTDLALQAAYSSQLDRIWVRARTQWETRFLATHEDLFETLALVQVWFGEAGLPVPEIPSRRIAGAVLDARLGVEDEAAAQALAMARLSLLAPDLVGTAAEGQIEARIADKMAPPTADEVAELIDAARPVPVAGAALVTRQELDEALAGLAPGGAASEVALRLEHHGTDLQPLPAQVWRTLQTDTRALVEGPWAVTGSALSVPELGEYLVDVRGFLAPVNTPVDVLLRVVGPQGVYTADSLTATAVGSVLNLSGVIAAAAGDVLQVQAYAEGAGVELLAGGLTISLRRQGSAPARRVLPAAQNSPWSEPAPDPAPAAARQATINLRLE